MLFNMTKTKNNIYACKKRTVVRNLFLGTGCYSNLIVDSSPLHNNNQGQTFNLKKNLKILCIFTQFKIRLTQKHQILGSD